MHTWGVREQNELDIAIHCVTVRSTCHCSEQKAMKVVMVGTLMLAALGGKRCVVHMLCAIFMTCRNADPYFVVFGASLLFGASGSSLLGIWHSLIFTVLPFSPIFSHR